MSEADKSEKLSGSKTLAAQFKEVALNQDIVTKKGFRNLRELARMIGVIAPDSEDDNILYFDHASPNSEAKNFKEPSFTPNEFKIINRNRMNIETPGALNNDIQAEFASGNANNLGDFSFVPAEGYRISSVNLIAELQGRNVKIGLKISFSPKDHNQDKPDKTIEVYPIAENPLYLSALQVNSQLIVVVDNQPAGEYVFAKLLGNPPTLSFTSVTATGEQRKEPGEITEFK
jgi:hypothetical protein